MEENKTLYSKQDYERNLYFEQYVTRVCTTLTTMYSDIDRIHKRIFGDSYPLPDEKEAQIIKDTLKGVRHTMCHHAHKHMREGKITPKLWPLCEAGGKSAENCAHWEEIKSG